ncbi:lipoyl(octanoyl) transferase LipB [Candidimonas sp. SYP-B2681]|uniref:lipoyl(octanoyl) transferase LipB n=1 Tax=Candidimonas sp. SYP-B2681 TaxID=2497686 RepID=UPI000F899C43|nr:lipoyl(octanoyl) transferase LipB [Candidimonas sp. SYP-B2681]RTZ45656.1 lipoyl(octanoyl) transferase LipB [Candidimonas sp. SYP-B2681]
MIQHRWWPGQTPYLDAWEAMRQFTEARDAGTADEIWLVEHPPVYTLGQAGKASHILNPGDIQVVQCDRGGQVTYHGPGQVVAYCLIDLRRLKIFVKEYVALIERATIEVLAAVGINGACLKPGAPGVYVPLDDHGAFSSGSSSPAGDDEPAAPAENLAKIAALGIKVRNGCAYHGIALNVDMDLTPFLGINPCGYEGLQTIDLRYCGIEATVAQVGELLAARLASSFATHAYGASGASIALCVKPPINQIIP